MFGHKIRVKLKMTKFLMSILSNFIFIFSINVYKIIFLMTFPISFNQTIRFFLSSKTFTDSVIKKLLFPQPRYY